ncbi:Haloacid Dehalogenase Superfamily Class (subfamily) IIA [Roseovarius nanhaiticus]|uniref:Haloacid Dehalogenase Superfamily Class (Subfamily) IIA n=1 Tax=Roseovarius nanhaiticus TaxID=573024 RepID=A0A1N7GXU3_9RHOB|nr:HAD hydrolase-like protein [Roseovarius nanhaiticus]SEL20705.1 Haloacid Dehalogenase Superfamily Class (subfamily) IIA [Roseovarius nanhaiticus]SIS17258.1 Haloacid Dehalogenase Superfamily Class (subfamily) IIA [Roseovarius nanhaiticus]
MLSAPKIFERYEQIRPRLPAAPPQFSARKVTQDIRALTDIASEASAFVFDAFGVLNVGDTLIEGADRRLDQLRARGCAIRILTNAASYDRAGAVAKFANLGLTVLPEEIITSRDAALSALTPGLWGVIAAPEDDLGDIAHEALRLGDDPATFDRADGFLFLSSSGWTDARQAMLQKSLAAHDRPVLIANADLVAPRDDGFSLEPGHYGHWLLDDGAARVRFFGKPFGEVYDLVEATLPSVAPDRIVMCGDTLHTDILGAAARGWRTVLVTQDGLFAGHDTNDFCERAALNPDWRLNRI